LSYIWIYVLTPIASGKIERIGVCALGLAVFGVEIVEPWVLQALCYGYSIFSEESKEIRSPYIQVFQVLLSVPV
jgi:hypothetical protein